MFLFLSLSVDPLLLFPLLLFLYCLRADAEMTALCMSGRLSIHPSLHVWSRLAQGCMLWQSAHRRLLWCQISVGAWACVCATVKGKAVLSNVCICVVGVSSLFPSVLSLVRLLRPWPCVCAFVCVYLPDLSLV